MTTRRQLIASTAGLVMGAATAPPITAQPTDWEELMRHRDELYALITDHNTMFGFSIMMAIKNLDHAIMRRCPHDPETYVRFLDFGVSDSIRCPACGAETFARNAKSYRDEQDPPLVAGIGELR